MAGAPLALRRAVAAGVHAARAADVVVGRVALEAAALRLREGGDRKLLDQALQSALAQAEQAVPLSTASDFMSIGDTVCKAVAEMAQSAR